MNNNEIKAKYKINKNKIKIFGTSFVKKNKNNCKIIYENKEYELKDIFEIDNNINKEILEIDLIGISNITDISYLFSECSSLISLSGISNIDFSKISYMQGMFNECSSLLYLPDISQWDISNITDISCLFNNCHSLSYIPDISKWNTSNITDMSFLFNGCFSLTSLPDISKWKLNENVQIDMIFGYCYSLSYIPDIFFNLKNLMQVYSFIGAINLNVNYLALDCINNISYKS